MSRILILYLLGLTLRSLMFAALAGLITFRMRGVASRHAVWTAVLGLLVLMPVADILLPAAMIPASAPEIILPVQTFVVTPAPAPVSSVGIFPAVPGPRPEVYRDWWQIAAFVWSVIAAALLCRLALACVAIARMKRRSVLVSVEGWDESAPMLRESGAITVPLTIGLTKPVLILPLGWRDWEIWKLRAVLAHELTHVRRMDWAIAVTASFARCVFWFNPLSWWLERHLSALAEQASDEACVKATGDAPRYAETLLHFAGVAKQGRRWIGGVAMAQYKISSRIERVLRLQRAGSGVLSKAGWFAVCLLGIPALYVAAAAQAQISAPLPPLSPAEIVRVVQQRVPVPEQPATPVTPAPQPAPMAQSEGPADVLTPTARAGILRYWSGWAPSAQQPQLPQNSNPPASPTPAPSPVAPVNPDLLGEIQLILAPVDQAQNAVPGQVQTSTGTNRFTGNVVWTFRNSGLNPNTWARNGNVFTFAMTGVQGRNLSFETSQGGTFSYGCPDCLFLASELGVSTLPNTGMGIIFRLSLDGKSVTATCRAVECRVASAAGIRVLKDAESTQLAVPPQPVLRDPSSPGLTCFSVFGNVKADGTPFTAADCPGGVAVIPNSILFFSVTR